MPAGQAENPGMTWLTFASVTVIAWGVYGVFLNTGQVMMADPANGRYKAYLFVGIAYFFTAVIAPLVMLLTNGANWHLPTAGMAWSLIAGIAGALGAFFVLLAFGAKGSPAVVMAIVFGGAPIVNAIVAMAMHPPAGGLSAIRWPFVLGLLLAAAGGCLVTLYRPMPAGGHAAVPAPAATAAQTQR